MTLQKLLAAEQRRLQRPLDEWFLAGDAEFLETAQNRLEDMVRGAEILVLSSHQTSVLSDWCTRVMWLDQGRIREDGAPETVVESYLGPSLLPKDAVPS